MALLYYYDIVFALSFLLSFIYFHIWWKYYDNNISIIFILVPVINLGYAFLAHSQDLNSAIIALKITFIGCFLVFFVTMSMINFCELKKTQLIKISLGIVNTGLFILSLTIGHINLFYRSLSMVEENGKYILVKEFGPGHTVFVCAMAAYIFVWFGVIIYSLLKKKQFPKRILYLLLATSVISALGYITKNYFPVDPNPATYIFAQLVYLVIIRRMTLYQVGETVVESMVRSGDTGFISIDFQQRFLGANETAKKIFPVLKDMPIDGMLSDVLGLNESIQNWIDGFEENNINNTYQYKQDENGPEKIYQVKIDYLYDGKRKRGYQIFVKDDTLNQQYIALIDNYNNELIKKVEERSKGIVEAEGKLRESLKRIENINMNIIRSLSFTIDAKDRYTSGHSKRVADYAVMIAERMGKSERDKTIVYYAGLLHDVGKIRVPEDVINKPGKLSDEEFDSIRIHTVSGYDILLDIHDDERIVYGAKYHHEKYDGSGYPNGLSGENIPEIARIIAVADAYDAMASDRSYRKALPQDVVRKEIEKGKGKQFDPKIADLMLEIIDEDKDYNLRQKQDMKYRILIIDDDSVNITFVKGILGDMENTQFYAAQSEKEALKVLAETKIDLIMLDLIMPDIDGFTLFKEIRAMCEIPVILMTADKSLETVTKIHELHIEDYLTKPLDMAITHEAVHGLLHRAGAEVLYDS